MLDTDICSYALKGHARVTQHFRAYQRHDMAISAITEAELRYGAAKRGSSRFTADLEGFLLRFEVLEFSSADTHAYAQLRLALDRAGRVVGAHDMLIAAHALTRKLVLVTNNEREFRRVPGLKIENWSVTPGGV